MITLTFKESLQKHPYVRKVFGKREIEIIVKQLEGYPLTQSERNRLSRDIKPKLEFMKAIAPYQEEFTIKRNQENKRVMEKAVQMILHDQRGEDVKAILLFGSVADKSFTKSSDIDIAVVFHKDISIKEATAFRIRVSGELPEKVDVQVFNMLPEKIKREVARNHRVLYHDSGYDNVTFTIKYLKDEDYVKRKKRIFETAE